MRISDIQHSERSTKQHKTGEATTWVNSQMLHICCSICPLHSHGFGTVLALRPLHSTCTPERQHSIQVIVLNATVVVAVAAIVFNATIMTVVVVIVLLLPHEAAYEAASEAAYEAAYEAAWVAEVAIRREQSIRCSQRAPGVRLLQREPPPPPQARYQAHRAVSESAPYNDTCENIHTNSIDTASHTL